MQRIIIVGIAILLLILIAISVSFWYQSNLVLFEVNSTVTAQAKTINQDEENRLIQLTAIAERKAELATVEAKLNIQTTAQSNGERVLATTQTQLESQRKLALAYRLAAHSQSVAKTVGDATLYPSDIHSLPKTIELSTLLAIESLHQSPTMEGDIALRQIVTQLNRKSFVRQDSVIDEVVFSPAILIMTNWCHIWD